MHAASIYMSRKLTKLIYKTYFPFVSDEMLIELVKSKPELYDLTSVHYSDNVAKRKTWVEVGRHLGCDGKKFNI